LRAQLARDEAVSARRASLAVLERLTGRTIAPHAVLALPSLGAEVARTQSEGRVDALRARPEFTQFALTRARLDREAALTHVENRPRVLAFGQAGLGRPGLNQFRTDPDEFWQAGLRVEWRPWTWRSAERASEALRLQQRIVTTEERALAEQLARAVESDLADMQRLRDALTSDERLVALRTDIERQSRAQFTEGVITAAEYVETRTDVVEANLALQRHRAELAQAEARYLTTLGLAPRSLQP
jgi:outer membrane protein TolC